MKTDRELLELAAKAAGIEHAICYDAHPEDGFPTAYAKTGKRTYWNPLTDDGDALRLAVALELDILHRVVGGTRVEILPAGGPLTQEFYADASARLAATRRAIVRAAAGIGAKMKEKNHEGS